jgi:hypothetical protein
VASIRALDREAMDFCGELEETAISSSAVELRAARGVL